MVAVPGVDVEAMAINLLLSDAGVLALVGERVYQLAPDDRVYPLLRLQRIGGPTDRLGWLDKARLQVEAWARYPDQALDLARTAHAALLRAGGEMQEGVWSGAVPLTGLLFSQDPESGLPRYLFDVQVSAHPHPA